MDSDRQARRPLGGEVARRVGKLSPQRRGKGSRVTGLRTSPVSFRAQCARVALVRDQCLLGEGSAPWKGSEHREWRCAPEQEKAPSTRLKKGSAPSSDPSHLPLPSFVRPHAYCPSPETFPP